MLFGLTIWGSGTGANAFFVAPLATIIIDWDLWPLHLAEQFANPLSQHHTKHQGKE